MAIIVHLHQLNQDLKWFLLFSGCSRGAHQGALRPDLPSGQEPNAVRHGQHQALEDRVRDTATLGEQPYGMVLVRGSTLQHAG